MTKQDVMPGRILLLGREVVERIAAGEVIERPASVVRELLDNAIDAGATTIRVEMQDGGLKLLRVADDGIGILADDLSLALAAHATSKLHSLADLEQVSTLGFRGEALASIVAVAEIEMASAADDDGLAQVLQAGPEIAPLESVIPRARGTTIAVRELFAMVPARRAMLRSARVEAGHVMRVVRSYALAHPAIRFTLVGDGTLLLQTPGTDLTEAVAAIYGSDVARSLLPFDRVAVGEATLAGVVGARPFHAATREHVLLVINGRPVTNRALLAALESGYRPLLRKGRHPLLIATVAMPASDLDVNIHPAKAEVLLRHEQSLAPALRTEVHDALGRAPVSGLAGAGDATIGLFTRPMPLRFPQRRLRRGTRVAERRQRYDADADETALDPGEWEPLAQFDDALILARTAAGHLLLIDQHRAHERILYERLMQRSLHAQAGDGRENPAVTQLLLQPVLVELSPLQARQLEPRLDELRALGLDCQPFGGSVFLVRSVPQLPGMASDAADIAAALTEDAATDSNDWLNVVCASLACRTAIRRGQSLTIEEQRALLADLRGVATLATCPHGSPLLLRYTHTGLARAFEW